MAGRVTLVMTELDFTNLFSDVSRLQKLHRKGHQSRDHHQRESATGESWLRLGVQLDHVDANDTFGTTLEAFDWHAA